jgi:hypothetical protein
MRTPLINARLKTLRNAKKGILAKGAKSGLCLKVRTGVVVGICAQYSTIEKCANTHFFY